MTPRRREDEDEEGEEESDDSMRRRRSEDEGDDCARVQEMAIINCLMWNWALSFPSLAKHPRWLGVLGLGTPEFSVPGGMRLDRLLGAALSLSGRNRWLERRT